MTMDDSLLVTVANPYVTPKVVLLNNVAKANRCQVVMTNSDAGRGGWLFGFPADMENVEMLFTSLLVQSLELMPESHGDRARSFRRAFLLGFASRIGERLRVAAHAAQDEAVAEHGSGLLPVLVSRDKQVASAVREQFPRLRTNRRVSTSNGSGYRAGADAANRADLGQRRVSGARALSR
jgi:hypothetical protein